MIALVLALSFGMWGSGVAQAAPPVQRATPVYQDAPEISRSRGAPNSIVVFWPRVVPRTSDPGMHALATQVQQQMVAAVREAHPGRLIDIRPAPERVCPRAGCDGPTFGVLLVHQGEACVAVALVSGAGKSPAQLQPWAGEVQLKQAVVPFREPPESQISIRDFALCSEIPRLMLEGRAPVLPALRPLVPPG